MKSTEKGFQETVYELKEGRELIVRKGSDIVNISVKAASCTDPLEVSKSGARSEPSAYWSLVGNKTLP